MKFIIIFNKITLSLLFLFALAGSLPAHSIILYKQAKSSLSEDYTKMASIVGYVQNISQNRLLIGNSNNSISYFYKDSVPANFDTVLNKGDKAKFYTLFNSVFYIELQDKQYSLAPNTKIEQKNLPEEQGYENLEEELLNDEGKLELVLSPKEVNKKLEILHNTSYKTTYNRIAENLATYQQFVNIDVILDSLVIYCEYKRKKTSYEFIKEIFEKDDLYKKIQDKETAYVIFLLTNDGIDSTVLNQNKKYTYFIPDLTAAYASKKSSDNNKIIPKVDKERGTAKKIRTGQENKQKTVDINNNETKFDKKEKFTAATINKKLKILKGGSYEYDFQKIKNDLKNFEKLINIEATNNMLVISYDFIEEIPTIKKHYIARIADDYTPAVYPSKMNKYTTILLTLINNLKSTALEKNKKYTFFVPRNMKKTEAARKIKQRSLELADNRITLELTSQQANNKLKILTGDNYYTTFQDIKTDIEKYQKLMDISADNNKLILKYNTIIRKPNSRYIAGIPSKNSDIYKDGNLKITTRLLILINNLESTSLENVKKINLFIPKKEEF